MVDKQQVLILCTGNSARSQIAEGLLRQIGGGAFEVFSAGPEPSHVRPLAIAAMKEIGVDISGHRSKSVDEFPAQEFAYVITVCDNANERCPVFPVRSNGSIGALTIRPQRRVSYQTNSRSFAASVISWNLALRDFIKLHGQSTSHYENE